MTAFLASHVVLAGRLCSVAYIVARIDFNLVLGLFHADSYRLKRVVLLLPMTRLMKWLDRSP